METTISKSVTAGELMELSLHGRYELIEGVITEMSPAGEQHGLISSIIIQIVGHYVRKNKLGITTSSETGYKLSSNPDTVKAPDMAFKSNKTLSKGDIVKGYSEIMPDLVVEVNSPADKFIRIIKKVDSWLKAGVKEVWVFDPEERSIAIYKDNSRTRILDINDELDRTDILPGFKCSVREFFEI